MKTKTKSLTGEEIKSLHKRIRNFSRRNLSAVKVILLDHALEMVEWAANYCGPGEDVYFDSDVEIYQEVIAHYQAAQVLSKLVAGTK